MTDSMAGVSTTTDVNTPSTMVATVVATAVDEAQERHTQERLEQLEQELRERAAREEGERRRPEQADDCHQLPLVHATKSNNCLENIADFAKG